MKKKLEQLPTKERILETAANLFYTKGYVNTGIEEIIGHCNIKKPSLYYYYKSKSELGLAYLDYKELEALSNFDSIHKRTKTVKDFYKSWTNHVKRSAREKSFYGCPFSAIAIQLPIEEKEIFHSTLNRIKINWLAKIQSILEEKSSKYPENQSIDYSNKALETMVIYVGASNLYRMSGQIEFLTSMGNQFEGLGKQLDREY
ncbi:MAG: TetR/AcrR family transcriptional regulator [Spirochaetia bacterium]|nr:TetR/AcrR family transcriptional regulator [Spirochaetia bacterium]